MNLLKKIKERFSTKTQKKVFLLVSFKEAVPQILRRSTKSNILYRMLDFNQSQDVLTLEEYETIVQNQN